MFFDEYNSAREQHKSHCSLNNLYQKILINWAPLLCQNHKFYTYIKYFKGPRLKLNGQLFEECNPISQLSIFDPQRLFIKR